MQLTQCHEFFGRIDKRVSERELILHAMLELTTNCCLDCIHCYCKGTPYPGILTEEWKRTIDHLCEVGCFSVVFTGGEPLVRSDFAELFVYTRKKGILASLFTNAVLLDNEIISVFQKYPPELIDISLYGNTAETYERIAGDGSAFDAVMVNLERLKKSGLPFSLKSMVLKENLSEIQAIKRKADSLGVNFRFDPSLDATRNGSIDHFACQVTPRQAALIERLDARRYAKLRKFFEEQFGSSYPPPVNREFMCGAEIDHFSGFIRADGKFAPCLGLAPWAVELFRTDSDIGPRARFWERFYANHKGVGREFEDCRKCAYLVVCSRCMASEIAKRESGTGTEWTFECEWCDQRLALLQHGQEKGGATNGKTLREEKETVCSTFGE